MWIDFIAFHGERTPQRPALVLEKTGETLTYGDLHWLASCQAGYLRRKGVTRGDRVALLAKNRLEHLTLFFATMRLGAIFAPLNFRLADPEIQAQLDCIQPKLFLSDEDRLNSLSLDDQDFGNDPLNHTVTIEMDHVLLMLFTSGSTGQPKGVLLSAGMLLWNAINTHTGWELKPEDVSVIHTPFFHTGGYNVTCLPLLRLGGKLVLADFQPAKMLQIISDNGVTVFFAVPAMFRMMMETPEFHSADLSSIRFCISGGAPCPSSLIDAWRERGLPLKQGFGLTEVGPNCFYISDEDALSRQDSVGRPMLHSHIRLIDENGHDVDAGQLGELAIKGPHVCQGYWQNETEFQNVFRNGYFHTGDLMTCDEDGFYYVVGRSKDMFISGGENVYPGEVERHLVQHPNVADAHVLAVPCEKWGEVGFAFLSSPRQLSLEEVRNFLGPLLSRYKHPRHLLCLNQLPLLPNNKVDRRALLEMALKELTHG